MPKVSLRMASASRESVFGIDQHGTEASPVRPHGGPVDHHGQAVAACTEGNPLRRAAGIRYRLPAALRNGFPSVHAATAWPWWSTGPPCGLTGDFSVPCWSMPNTDSREADAMRRLTFGMNLSLDGYIAAPGDDLGWSVPSDELFQWWSDRVGATGLALYGRKLWETMSSHWPTADQQPGATPAEIEFAHRWRDMPKVVFSSTTSTVGWNTRLVTGDAVTEITRLKAEDGGPIDIGGATLAAAAMPAGLIDEYVLVTAPVLVGSGTPFFAALDNWVNLNLVEIRTLPDGVVLTRYETRR